MVAIAYYSKKIVAIGKNYEAHAREMGAKRAPKQPVIFLKPTTRCVLAQRHVMGSLLIQMRLRSYLENGGTVLLPPGIGEVHHEVELGVRFPCNIDHLRDS